MVLLGIIASLFVAIQDPIVQNFTVRFAGGYLSEKTGADIKVGRLIVTPDFKVIIDDVMVKDLKKNSLAKIGALRTKIDISDLIEGKIHLETVELRDTEANLITYKGEDRMNFAFLLDAFPSDTTKEKKSKPIEIAVDKISLKNVDFMLWNQNKADSLKTANRLMDYSHLDLDDINLEANDFYMFGDSIHAYIASLSAMELSGLELKSFQTDAIVSQKGILLDGLLMETNNSRFDMDLNMLFNNGFADFHDFVDSVVFDATIRPSDIMLSDIGVFTEMMYKMPDRVKFEGRFTGPIEHFRVDNIRAELGKSTWFQGSISMHPLNFNEGYHTLNIKKMRFTYDDLANFYIPSSSKTIPLPESLRPMNEGTLKMNFKGSYKRFVSDIVLKSGIGNVDVSIARSQERDGSNVFSGSINGNRVKVGTIAKVSNIIGDMDVNSDFSIKFPSKGDPELGVNGVVKQAELLGTQIAEVRLDGAMKENRFNGKVKVNDDDLGLDFDGLIDFHDVKKPMSDFNAVIHHADLHALNLMKNDSVSEISTTISINMNGFDLDELEGEVHIDNTVYRDSKGTYVMNSFNGSVINDNLMQRRINVNNDFFDFEMAGQINFASLMMTLNEYVDSYVHFPKWENKRVEFEEYKKNHDVNQDFIVKLNLKDTETISDLLMPSVHIAKNTSLNAAFTSRNNLFNLTLRSKNLQVGVLDFNDLEVKSSSLGSMAVTSLKLDGIAYSKISETDTLELGLDNIAIVARLTNDTVFGRISWDDDEEEDHNKASIRTYFHPHEHGGIFSVTEANIMLQDSLWTIPPDNYIDINNDRYEISNLMFSHHLQSIRIDGYAPMTSADTLQMQLRSFDISNFDFLLNSMGFDINGFVSGEGLVSDVKENLKILADLTIKDIAVNDDPIGDASIESAWNNEDKSVDVAVSIFNEDKKSLNAYGSYFTARDTDNLDFTVELDSLHLAILGPFLTGVVSRMQGYGNGKVDIKGSLNSPDINGKLVLDAGCNIDYLKTYYSFKPTVLIDNKSIRFEDMVLVDTLGNKARVEGSIAHNNLKDFNLDLRLYPRDFLAMATTSKDNDSFYGTAVANGLIKVKGPFKDIHMDIKALTRKGTHLTIPLNKASTVKDNDFIVFVSKEVEEIEEEEKPEKVKSNFSLDLEVNATDDASLKIILPSSIGTIDATGNGTVKLGTSSNEPLSMFGEYTIKSGRFQLTLMNVVTRIFNMQEGGIISWSGSPTDGRINATGVYAVKGSLSDLGVQVDTTSSSNNNVNVECLIHLKDALLNPTISFGMRLPNATEDVTQTVYTLIDTTNQSVMTTQALSLLVLGKFAYAGSSSTASQSFGLAGILAPKMQVDITNNLNLGLSYHAGSVDSYDEYQLALRTQLFEDRLTIETNVGVMTSSNYSNGTSNIVGEFDLYYKLSKDGRLQAHFYNHSNYNSNFNSFSIDRRAPYTQGLGLSFNKSFDKFRDLFKKKTTTSNNQSLIRPRR